MAKPLPHLHTHSHYSLLSGLAKIPDLIAAAEERGIGGLALTDNGSLYGAIEFYKACKKKGFPGIIGLDAYVAARGRRDKQAGIDNRRTRLVLLAEKNEGYRNLIRLATAAHLEGFYYKPRIDRELIERHKDGLIAISPAMGGEISQALRGGDRGKAKEIVGWYRNAFGADNFFLELTHHPDIEEHEKLARAIAELSEETGAPLVAAHEIYYLDPADKRARDTLLLVNSNSDLSERNADDESDFSLLAASAMERSFRETPRALENAREILARSKVELELGRWVFPAYGLPPGVSPDEALRNLAEDGYRSRGISKTPEIVKRVGYELDVIIKKGYAPYFLVVSDLLRYAKSRGIYSTTRGSAAGSMVSFLTYITTVNPMEYNLPFERFLNPERPSPPDIDMDIADNRRDEMIEYAKKKYGEDKVAQVGTFGTMLARGSVRDVARALGYPYALGDRLAKLIPMGSQGFPMSISRAMELVPEIGKIYKDEPEAKEIIDTAKKIEGCARHISIHAAGVVISPSPLTDFVPLQLDPKGGKIITQYDMHAVEDAGLLKFDFLGIKNLAILSRAVELAEKLEGVKVDIDAVPLDDKKTFALLAAGETEGLFQLNGSGMTRYLKELRPSTIHDLNVMIALYRPGPMGNIDEYIARKHKRKPVVYMHPAMKNFLEQTFGVLVYQDDLLMTATEVAGYTWGEVDKFRKAVGKKIPEEMAKQHIIFVEGCVRHGGMTKEKAESLWNLFEPFQGYGFNKAHAASYGKVAYQTAYMKAHFPSIYMSAVLTADSGDVEKIGETIAECKRLGIPVLPPSVNESFGGFTVVKGAAGDQDKIRFGLTTIKNLGEGIANAVIDERARGGRFASLADFLERVRDRNLNKKSLEALVKSGAADEFGERGELLANLEHLLVYNKEGAKAPESQGSLFGLMADTQSIPALRLEPAPPATTAEKLLWEKELLGLYISGHPLDKFKAVLEKREYTIGRVKTEFRQGMEAAIGGILEEAKQVITKSNATMMFARLADFSGSIEIVFFPKVYAEFKNILAPERCIAVKGRISNRNGATSLIAEKVRELA